jgi:hypothetical protein
MGHPPQLRHGHHAAGIAHPDQKANRPHRSLPHAVFEFTQKSHGVLEHVHSGADYANAAAKLMTGSQAFRKYSWIKNAPTFNASGNLRGMVIDRQARVAYDVTVDNSKILDKMGTALQLTEMLFELKKNVDNMHLTGNHVEDAQKLLLAPSMAIMKVVGKPVPTTAHIAAKAFEIGSRMTGLGQGHIEDVKLVDAVIQNSYEQMMNPDNVLHYINTRLVFVR